MSKRHLALTAGVAVLSSAIVLLIFTQAFGKSLDDQARRSDLVTCDSGNVSRAWNRLHAKPDEAKAAAKLFPIRDCVVFSETQKTVPVTPMLADTFIGFVRMGYKPKIRNGVIQDVG